MLNKIKGYYYGYWKRTELLIKLCWNSLKHKRSFDGLTKRDIWIPLITGFW